MPLCVLNTVPIGKVYAFTANIFEKKSKRTNYEKRFIYI